VVGVGFEVANTTPELYKGGSVTCYRQYARKQDVSVNSVVGPPAQYFMADYVSGLPDSLGDMTQIPSCATWGAEEGCYVVGVFNDTVNPPQDISYKQCYIGTERFSQPQNVAATTGAQLTKLNNMDFSGAYFSGLSDQASLTITTKVFLESFPNAFSSDITLARQVTDFDPVALELYNRCMAELPVGVRLAENPLGEWFDEILKGIETFAPMLSGIPVVGTIANIAKPIATGVRKAMGTKPSKKKQPNASAAVPTKQQ